MQTNTNHWKNHKIWNFWPLAFKFGLWKKIWPLIIFLVFLRSTELKSLMSESNLHVFPLKQLFLQICHFRSVWCLESERRGAIYNLRLILKTVEQRNGLQNEVINRYMYKPRIIIWIHWSMYHLAEPEVGRWALITISIFGVFDLFWNFPDDNN